MVFEQYDENDELVERVVVDKTQRVLQAIPKNQV